MEKGPLRKIRVSHRLLWFLGIACLLLSSPAFAAGQETQTGDPIAGLVLSVAIILVAAKLGGHFAVRLGQPPVLGELIVGVLIGNLSLLGYTGLDYLKDNVAVDLFARLGVIMLLFQVGLESTVAQMLQVGVSASIVAT